MYNTHNLLFLPVPVRFKYDGYRKPQLCYIGPLFGPSLEILYKMNILIEVY